jgi:RNA polymerase sigma-54 factor
MEHFTPRQAVIGEAIIDSINDDGYLTVDLDEIPASLDAGTEVSSREIEETLLKVQRLDPVGIGARSIAECIVLQLSQLDASTPALPLAIALAESHLDLIAKREYAELRRSLRTSEEYRGCR